MIEKTICDVIKKNESGISCDMLLVSEVLFLFNVNVCVETRHLSQAHISCYIDVTKMLCKP